MRLNWQWLIWQVGIPLGGPVILSWLIVLAWGTGNPDFIPKWSVVLDVSPWALTSYSLALIGAALNELWPRMPDNRALGWGLFGCASTTAIYTAFMVIWRHNTAFEPGPNVYILTGLLLLVTIFLCHLAQSTPEEYPT